MRENVSRVLIEHYLAKSGQYKEEKRIPWRYGGKVEGRYDLTTYQIEFMGTLLTYHPPLPIPNQIGRLLIRGAMGDIEKVDLSFTIYREKYQSTVL